jgi:hypothetical protein
MRTNNYDPTPLVAGTNTIRVCDEARQNAGGRVRTTRDPVSPQGISQQTIHPCVPERAPRSDNPARIAAPMNAIRFCAWQPITTT